MEHIFFEAQLCSEMAVFKEKHVFPILTILCLGTSLTKNIFELLFLNGNDEFPRNIAFAFDVNGHERKFGILREFSIWVRGGRNFRHMSDPGTLRMGL